MTSRSKLRRLAVVALWLTAALLLLGAVAFVLVLLPALLVLPEPRLEARDPLAGQNGARAAGVAALVHTCVAQGIPGKAVRWVDCGCPRFSRGGDPLDPATRFGALISETQMKTVLRYIGVAQNEGAALRLGGTRVREASGGYYVDPTIFELCELVCGRLREQSAEFDRAVAGVAS